MAGCHDQRCASSFTFEHCVRRRRRAMVDELEGAGPADFLLQDPADFDYTVLDPDALVWYRRGHFGPEGLAMGREHVHVREGAADIDTKLVALNSGGVAHCRTKATMGLSISDNVNVRERKSMQWRRVRIEGKRRRRQRLGKKILGRHVDPSLWSLQKSQMPDCLSPQSPRI